MHQEQSNGGPCQSVASSPLPRRSAARMRGLAHWLAALSGVWALGLGASSAHAAGCVIKAVDMPVRLVEHRPIVTVTVNGVELPMLLDTGAFFSFLSEATATDLKLTTRIDADVNRIMAVDGPVEVRVARPDSVVVQKSRLPRTEFLVGGDELNAGIRGILGRNLFANADLELDLAHGMVRIIEPSPECKNANMAHWAGDAPVMVTPMERGKHLVIRTEVQVNGETLNALIDTGAPSTVLSREAARRVGVAESDMTLLWRYERGGSEIRHWRATFKSFQIAGEKISNTQLQVMDTDLPYDVIIGLDYLLAHRLYISRQQKQIYITWNGGSIFVRQPAGEPDMNTRRMAAVPAEPEADDARSLFLRGYADLVKGNVPRAVADLERAVALKPDDGNFRLALGRALIIAQEPTRARTQLDEALRLDPTLSEARLLRATSSAAAPGAQAPEARAAILADVARLDADLPQTSHQRIELGELYAQYAMAPQAQRQWDLWLASHPEDRERAGVFNSKCWLLTRLGVDLNQALDFCQSAVKADSTVAAHHDSLGWTYLRLGDATRATEAFNRSLALNKTSAWSLYGRALAEFTLKGSDNARTDLALARKLRPDIDKEVREEGFDLAATLLPAGT